MKNNPYFIKAQELCREAVMYGKTDKWIIAMRLLRKGNKSTQKGMPL